MPLSERENPFSIFHNPKRIITYREVESLPFERYKKTLLYDFMMSGSSLGVSRLEGGPLNLGMIGPSTEDWFRRIDQLAEIEKRGRLKNTQAELLGEWHWVNDQIGRHYYLYLGLNRPNSQSEYDMAFVSIDFDIYTYNFLCINWK